MMTVDATTSTTLRKHTSIARKVLRIISLGLWLPGPRFLFFFFPVLGILYFRPHSFPGRTKSLRASLTSMIMRDPKKRGTLRQKTVCVWYPSIRKDSISWQLTWRPRMSDYSSPSSVPECLLHLPLHDVWQTSSKPTPGPSPIA